MVLYDGDLTLIEQVVLCPIVLHFCGQNTVGFSSRLLPRQQQNGGLIFENLDHRPTISREPPLFGVH